MVFIKSMVMVALMHSVLFAMKTSVSLFVDGSESDSLILTEKIKPVVGDFCKWNVTRDA